MLKKGPYLHVEERAVLTVYVDGRAVLHVEGKAVLTC
jgi:hypothetical protein